MCVCVCVCVCVCGVCVCVCVCVCVVCVFLSGLLIEMWKVTKVVEIRVDRRNLIGGVLPRISFIDRPSYQSTKKYDMVGWVCVCVLYSCKHTLLHTTLCIYTYTCVVFVSKATL